MKHITKILLAALRKIISRNISEKEFIDAITSVAKQRRLNTSKYSYSQCTDFSWAVIKLARELNLDADGWETTLRSSRNYWYDPKEDNQHNYFRLGDKYYDFTARQFGKIKDGKLISRFPVIMDKPYPNSIKVEPKREHTLTEMTDNWYNLFKQKLGLETDEDWSDIFS